MRIPREKVVTKDVFTLSSHGRVATVRRDYASTHDDRKAESMRKFRIYLSIIEVGYTACLFYRLCAHPDRLPDSSSDQLLMISNSAPGLLFQPSSCPQNPIRLDSMRSFASEQAFQALASVFSSKENSTLQIFISTTAMPVLPEPGSQTGIQVSSPPP